MSALMEPIPDEVCLAALELVLKPLGTSMRHYSMQKTRQGAIEAMRGILQAERERAAAVLEDYPPEPFFEALFAATSDDGTGFRQMVGDTGNWAAFMCRVLPPYATAIRGAAA
jgi:hypothetical protein